MFRRRFKRISNELNGLTGLLKRLLMGLKGFMELVFLDFWPLDAGFSYFDLKFGFNFNFPTRNRLERSRTGFLEVTFLMLCWLFSFFGHNLSFSRFLINRIMQSGQLLMYYFGSEFDNF